MASSSDLLTRASEAFIDDHFELAVDLYSQAIALNPSKADLYADRAQAHIKLKSFTDAAADATKATELDPSMGKAYFRKGVACMKLKDYATAKTALETGSSVAPGDSRFNDLIKECDHKLAEDAPAPTQSNMASSAKNVAVPPAKPKYRHEFYQKPEEVVVTIFAKGVPSNSVAVDFGEQILSVNIEVPGEEAYRFQPRLFGKIVPEKCRYNAMSTKIEIRLAKADDAVHWTSLEFSRTAAVVQKAVVPSGSQRPSYPSSKPKRVDWDKLEAQVKKEEKEEKLDGDAAVNKFFREIYGNADEDTRRAMSKSFVESNGTVLSTNWNEVGVKKVEGSAPEGMEMKKWEY